MNLSRIGDLVASDDGTLISNTPPVLTGVPSDLQQLQALGRLRLHGALRVATQLVGTAIIPHASLLDTSLAELSLAGTATADVSPSAPLSSPSARAQDEELLKAIAEESTALCFVNRHLMLFERGLVIADAAVEAKGKLRCQFRHYLSFCQIAILVSNLEHFSDKNTWPMLVGYFVH